MTYSDIYKAVRWCFDEETPSDTLMNNIIKAHVGDALRWVCLHAPSELLTGTDSASLSSYVKEISTTPVNSMITLPADYLRLVRVRGNLWHRSVKDLISEDSEEYLQLSDENGASATIDRPQAALIETKNRKIELWPSVTSTVTLTYIATPTMQDDTTDSSQVDVPSLACSSFIYYLAYLTLSAYGDERAARMLEIATANLGTK